MARDERYEARKEYISKWARERWRRAKADGLCTSCFKERAKYGSTSCAACDVKRNARHKARAPILREAKKNSGVCSKCTTPLDRDADAGCSSCINCRQRAFGLRWTT